MDTVGERPSVPVKEAIVQRTFTNPFVQNVFREWCRINDSIRPEFTTRRGWQRDRILSGKDSDGVQNIRIPFDLQPSEMIVVMEAIDNDTFADRPDKHPHKAEELRNLGVLFRNAGIYIAQRLDSIPQGKSIATDLAEDFYRYGVALSQGKKSEKKVRLREIKQTTLTPEEITAVDRFLAGESLYHQRMSHVQKLAGDDESRLEELMEQERQRTLAQFFRITDKAIASEPKPRKETIIHRVGTLIQEWKDFRSQEKGRDKEADDGISGKIEAWREYQQFFDERSLSLDQQKRKDELEAILFTRKPWMRERSVGSAFLQKIRHNMQRAVETPKRELHGAIFRRGMDMLVNTVGYDKLPEAQRQQIKFLREGEPILRAALGIDQLHDELQALKEKMRGASAEDLAREYQDLTPEQIISRRELEIADTIQQAVSNFIQKKIHASPSHLIATQELNCVGGSLLGGALLSEVGIPYLVGSIPEHALLLVVTQDKSVHWRDMVLTTDNVQLTDDMIEGKNLQGLPLTVSDIVDYSQHAHRDGLKFSMKSDWLDFRDAYPISLSTPEYGHQIQMLNNLSGLFVDQHRYQEVMEVSKQAIALDPNYVPAYIALGDALKESMKWDEAREVFQQAIAIDPNYALAYEGLGQIFLITGQTEDAIETLQKSLALNPKNASVYESLGNSYFQLNRFDEAIVTLQQALVLAPESASTHKFLGDALRETGRLEETVAAYQQAITFDPDTYTVIYHNMGDILVKLGKPNEAAEAYQKYISYMRDKYGERTNMDELASLEAFIQSANVATQAAKD